MKVACISFTEDGKRIGDRLVKYRDVFQNKDRHTVHHYENPKINGGVKGLIKDIFYDYEGIIFVSATGIAVRMLNPYIKDKTTDPAVVVIDDQGKYSISLLSGHQGGANKLSKWVATILGSISVVTTASEGRGIEAIDTFAKDNKYEIEDRKAVKKIMTMMVNKKRIGFYSEDKHIINYDNLIMLKELKEVDNLSGLIAITSKENHDTSLTCAILRLKNINIGIGCKKGIKGARIISAIREELNKNNLSEKCIKAIGTIEAKKNEEGIIEASDYFNAPLKSFTVEEIAKIEGRFSKSDFVKKTLGVYSVSEPSAYLLGGEMRVFKEIYDGITISISVEVNDG